MNPIMNLLLLGVPIDTRPYHQRFPQDEEEDEEEDKDSEDDRSEDLF